MTHATISTAYWRLLAIPEMESRRMKLMSITLQRFKRFEEKTEIDVAGDMIALVGPNEAGKSSVLEAMLSLNDTGPFPETEQTRDTSGLMCVSAGYILDD